MVFESWYWKRELLDLIESINENSKPFNQGDYDEMEFRLERAIIYSAFVSRLLIDAEKLTSLITDHRFTLSAYQNIDKDYKRRMPIMRKYPDPKLYNFDNCVKRTVSATYLINQIIHSFVIITFYFDESSNIIGFFVTSDYDAEKTLYYVDLKEWVCFIDLVANDEVTSIVSHYDDQKKNWITVRS